MLPPPVLSSLLKASFESFKVMLAGLLLCVFGCVCSRMARGLQFCIFHGYLRHSDIATLCWKLQHRVPGDGKLSHRSRGVCMLTHSGKADPPVNTLRQPVCFFEGKLKFQGETELLWFLWGSVILCLSERTWSFGILDWDFVFYTFLGVSSALLRRDSFQLQCSAAVVKLSFWRKGAALCFRSVVFTVCYYSL